MNKIISLYKSQKQKFWTHILLPFTFASWGFFAKIYYDATFASPKLISGAGMYFFLDTMAYSCIFPIILVIAIIEFFLKTKIKNKFILENKVYNVIWNIGNLLAFIFVMFMICFIFYPS